MSQKEVFVITGGKQLSGSIKVVGAKNAALKFLAASSILEGETTFTNVPQIEDIHRMVELMQTLGLKVTHNGSEVKVVGGHIDSSKVEPGLHQKLRASILLVGPALLSSGRIHFTEPGGCVLGKRPIDFFLQGFAKLGAKVTCDETGYLLEAQQLHGGKIIFPRVSWMATEAFMTFAARLPGTTHLVNCAMEPEVVDLANFLNACGARITGAGTPFITIEGVETLRAQDWRIIPDRLEAGTFAMLAATTKSDITITDCHPEHLEVLWELFHEAEVVFDSSPTSVTVYGSKTKLKAIEKNIVTHEYPGLPTDLQAPLTVMMTQALGKSLIHETIYDGRLFYTDVLNTMGADIFMSDPHRVLVSGPTPLFGRRIASPDIRAGIALLIAGLAATGTTVMDNIYQIDRGYERIEERLRDLGAQITRDIS